MPRIGLDLRPTEPGFKAHFGRGTGRYTSELVKHLAVLSGEGQYYRMQLLPVGSEALGASGLERAAYKFLPLGRVTVEQQLLLPKRIKRLGVDLFHFFAHVDAPASCVTPYVITILDLIPLKFPDLYKADKTNWRYNFARFLERKAIERATGIIAISRATKQDIVDLLGVDPDQIVVTPLAVSELFSPAATSWDESLGHRKLLRKKLGLPVDRSVLLYVGGIDARKNVFFMLDVIAELKKLSSPGDVPLLVMVGRYQNDRNFGRLQDKIEQLDLKGDVILQGYVEDDSLPDLYRMANILLFPSLYEGFGLPVLESLACGTPVVAGKNSSIPEVCGDAAVLLRDNDCGSWVKELQALLQSEDRQRELSEQGLVRARQFSWAQTARLTLDAYSYFLEPKRVVGLPLTRVDGAERGSATNTR